MKGKTGIGSCGKSLQRDTADNAYLLRRFANRYAVKQAPRRVTYRVRIAMFQRLSLGMTLMMFGLFGCSGKTTPTVAPFRFQVEHVFYIKPPVDRVILVGVVREGAIKVGDRVTVGCRNGDVNVTIDGIESIGQELKQAGVGQQVGLKLQGIDKDQPNAGDWVYGCPGT